MYHGEPMNLHRGVERFDEGTGSDHFHEGTSSNHFLEDNEMLAMFHDLQAPIQYEEETKEGLENDMLFKSGVEQETMNIFQKLLNQARTELYSNCSEFSFLNFLVTLIHVKVLNS